MSYPLPQDMQSKIKEAEDLPGYLNRKQIALACGIEEKTTHSWKDLPLYDLKIGVKYYWLPETVANFIYTYREKTKADLK